MKKILIILVLLGAAAGGAYHWLYPPAIYARRAQLMLDSLSEAVKSQDRAAIARQMTIVFADAAHISFELDTPTGPGAANRRVEKQDFNKAEFLGFVDNILYSIRDYDLSIRLQRLSLGAGRTSAGIEFTATELARGHPGSVMDGNMRYRGDTHCSGELDFSDKASRIMRLSCVTEMRYALAH